MSPLTRFCKVVLPLVFCGALVSCGVASGDSGGPSVEPGGERTLTIFAASSLTDAFEELSEVYEKNNPGVELRVNFTGSSILLNQLSQGAPADVFSSADLVKMESAVEKGVVNEDAPRTFARNRLVIIVPESNPAKIDGLRGLSESEVKFVLPQKGVPAAEYAKVVFDKAGTRYGSDFESKVLSNVVSREPDVRVAVSRVALGEADATLGYASDVTPDVEDKVKVLEIPQGVNVVANYPIAPVKSSENPELARRWIELVMSDEGQEVLRRWGFESVT